ncbi:MAG: hypothetical protein R3A47_05020 [Polyangiales bacterium]
MKARFALLFASLMLVAASGCNDPLSTGTGGTGGTGGTSSDMSGSFGNPACVGARASTENEHGDAACNDGCDNDGNGIFDCADFACRNAAVCGKEQSEVACSDGIDNDSDRKVDCNDPGCADAKVCGGTGLNPETCTLGAENTLAACTDGCSNDGDAFVDCDDQDCYRNPDPSIADRCGRGNVGTGGTAGTGTGTGGTAGTGTGTGGTAGTGTTDPADGAVGSACTDDAECEGSAEKLCASEANYGFPGGYCTDACTTDAQCGDGNVCYNGYCFVGCTDATQCRATYSCIDANENGTSEDDGLCMPSCYYDYECRTDEVCNTNTGLCDPANGGGGGGGGGNGTQTIGATCTDDSQCVGSADKLCASEALYGFPDGYCTDACATDADCGAGNTCYNGYCFVGCDSADLCRPTYSCIDANEDGSIADDGMCMPSCYFDYECREGEVCNTQTGLCDPANGGGGGGGTTDSKVGGACTADTNCDANGFCVAESNGFPGGYCTIFDCTTNADCGTGNLCLTTTNGSACYDGCQTGTDCR